MPHEHWKPEPEEHDFPAAVTYLSLIADPVIASAIADSLRTAPTTTFKAKDLLRASALSLLARENAHVSADLAKVKNGQLLSPVLLVRGDAARRLPLIVADGYHRICASYQLDENADILCRIAEWPS